MDCRLHHLDLNQQSSAQYQILLVNERWLGLIEECCYLN
jgi:hypothetical protein